MAGQKFLMIENPGVCPVECFTLLGVSTSRDSGNKDIIGEFGTGAKQAVCLLLREFNISPTIFCSLLKMEYGTIRKVIDDGISTPRAVRQVTCKFTGKDSSGKQINRTDDLGFVVELGARDWNDWTMALREYTANAIDRSCKEGSPESIVITITEENQVRAKAGYTRVFIPMEEELIWKYLQSLNKRFLHFANQAKTMGALSKNNREMGNNSGVVVFKKGVRVCEMDEKRGLFDYNFGEELAIDESRKVYSGDVKREALRYILNTPSKIGAVVENLVKGGDFWEQDLNYYDYAIPEQKEKEKEIKKIWIEAFNEKTGGRGVIGSDVDEINVILKDRGYLPVKLNNNWKQILRLLGVKTVEDVLNKEDMEGIKYQPPGFKCRLAYKIVWDTLLSLKMIPENSLEPDLRVFTQSFKINRTSRKDGFYDKNGDIIAINLSVETAEWEYLVETMFEEVIHYVSKEGDFSRGFQNFIFKSLARLALKTSPEKI